VAVIIRCRLPVLLSRLLSRVGAPAPEGVDPSWRDHALTSVRKVLEVPCDALHFVNVSDLALDLDAMLLGMEECFGAQDPGCQAGRSVAGGC
jgi:hypothetical protein